MIDGVKCGPDGLRCDVDGNLWVSSNAGRALGYSGVTVWNPAGKLLGRIRLPEVCGNLTLRRTETESPVHGREPIDLRVYVGTQGAAARLGTSEKPRKNGRVQLSRASCHT